jgi:REP element-mobilizing transposase RayT
MTASRGAVVIRKKLVESFKKITVSIRNPAASASLSRSWEPQPEGMRRSFRIEFPGAFYHVMARGNHREVIYGDDDDRRYFLKTLGEVCDMTGWRVHAWALMGNHYQLVIETPEANLVAGMQWLQNTDTRRFNVRHRLWGRLFGAFQSGVGGRRGILLRDAAGLRAFESCAGRPRGSAQRSKRSR